MLTREEIANFDMSPVIQLCYDFILPISYDRVLATHGGEISLITKSGELICTYQSIYVPTFPDEIYYDEAEEIYKYTEAFIDDVLIFVENGKKGIMDYDGDIILDAEYNEITFNADKEAEILP